MRLRVLILLLLAMAFGSVAVHAHAMLDRASPPVGSTVASAPRELSLTFTQNLEAAFSSVQVTDANGARVDQGKPQVSGNTMRVGLKSLSPGQALSVDTHKTEGGFTFTVGGR
jgi:copper resistance protein C